MEFALTLALSRKAGEGSGPADDNQKFSLSLLLTPYSPLPLTTLPLPHIRLPVRLQGLAAQLVGNLGRRPIFRILLLPISATRLICQ
jgi:hypothetical protein